MAACLNVDKSTLSKRYSTEIEKGRLEGKKSLRRKMFETAMNGNVTMQIWLSKQYLDHKDKVETTEEHNVKVTYTSEELQQMKEQLKKALELPK